MNIIYKKDTLYVYLDTLGCDVYVLESRINSIIDTYNIDNLVINTNGYESLELHNFENRYNQRHRAKMIIK